MTNRWCSQHHFDHGVGAERAVQLVELLAAGGGDGDRHAQVLAALAFAQLNGGGVKSRVKLVCNHGDGMYQSFNLHAHHFDGKERGVFNQGFGAGDVGCCSHGAESGVCCEAAQPYRHG